MERKIIEQKMNFNYVEVDIFSNRQLKEEMQYQPIKNGTNSKIGII